MLEIREPTSFGVAQVVRFEPGNGEASAAALRAALARHGVLCLRIYRALEEDEFRSLAELFGPVKDPVARAKDGFRSREAAEAFVKRCRSSSKV